MTDKNRADGGGGGQAGNRTTQRPPDNSKETQTVMVMSPVDQVWPNQLARHSEWGKKARQTEEEVGRQHQGMDRPGVRPVQELSLIHT